MYVMKVYMNLFNNKKCFFSQFGIPNICITQYTHSVQQRNVC